MIVIDSAKMLSRRVVNIDLRRWIAGVEFESVLVTDRPGREYFLATVHLGPVNFSGCFRKPGFMAGGKPASSDNTVLVVEDMPPPGYRQ